MDIVNSLLTPQVLAYLLIVVSAQAILFTVRQVITAAKARKRAEAGLPPDSLINHTQRLATLRWDAFTEAAVLVLAVVVTPFLLIASAPDEAAKGLATAFLILLIWVLFSNSEMGKAFVGGVVLRTLIAFKTPFQVGDRVTLKGHGGKVLEIGSFFVKLQTPDDDLITIPTYQLWSEAFVSANAGDRASLCVMPFYLAPCTSKEQRQQAEDIIWNAIQASFFFDFGKPLQIFLEQRENAIVLTAKAYVASTYNEPLFKSDVTRAFLDFVDKEHIPLAWDAWRISPTKER
jgi:small-conductance mechanosensitive channel